MFSSTLFLDVTPFTTVFFYPALLSAYFNCCLIVAIILRILFIAPIPKFIYRSLTKPATIGFGATLSGAQVI